MKRVYINPSTNFTAVGVTYALLALSKLNSNVQQNGNGETLSPARKLYV